MCRRVFLIAICLTVGLAINLACAWSFARWGGYHWEYSSNSVTLNTNPTAWPGPVDEGWQNEIARPRPTMAEATHEHVMSGVTATHAIGRTKVETRVGTFFYHRAYAELQFGWPLRALQRDELSRMDFAALPEHSSWNADGLRGGIGRQERNDFFRGAQSTLPVLPLWTGFIINTLLYAVAFGGLWLLLVRWKMRFRASRGLCSRCRYPIEGLVRCPECGTLVATSES